MPATTRLGTRVETREEAELDWGLSLLDPATPSSCSLVSAPNKCVFLRLLTHSPEEVHDGLRVFCDVQRRKEDEGTIEGRDEDEV